MHNTEKACSRFSESTGNGLKHLIITHLCLYPFVASHQQRALSAHTGSSEPLFRHSPLSPILALNPQQLSWHFSTGVERGALDGNGSSLLACLSRIVLLTFSCQQVYWGLYPGLTREHPDPVAAVKHRPAARLEKPRSPTSHFAWICLLVLTSGGRLIWIFIQQMPMAIYSSPFDWIISFNNEDTILQLNYIRFNLNMWFQIHA